MSSSNPSIRQDEIREFEKGRFEIVKLGGLTIGRATYQEKCSTEQGRIQDPGYSAPAYPVVSTGYQM